MSRIGLAGGLAAVALLVVCASAGAVDGSAFGAPRIDPLPIPSSASIVGDDGTGHVVYREPGAAGPADARWYDVELASRSSREVPSPGAGCTIDAAGPGGLIGSCPSDDGRQYYLSGLPFDQWTPCGYCDPLNHVSQSSYGFAVVAVGTEWIEYRSYEVHGYGGPGYLSRHGLPSQYYAFYPDINSPQLAVAPCATVAASRTVAYTLFAYDEPWGLGRTKSSHGLRRLYAQRCTWSHPHLIARSTKLRFDVQPLDGNLAGWRKGTRSYVRNLDSGRTLTISNPRHTMSVRLVGDYVLAERDGDSTTTTGEFRTGHAGLVRLPPGFLR